EFARDFARQGLFLEQRVFFVFTGEVQLTEEILVSRWTERKVVVFVETLKVRFDERMHGFHLRNENGLTADDTIEKLIHLGIGRRICSRRRRRCCSRRILLGCLRSKDETAGDKE